LKRNSYFASASALTLAIGAPCDDNAAATPMAPMVLPSTRIGSPKLLN